MLSPDHAVFVDDVLVPIRYLINKATISQQPARETTYWHVELERHDVILAEGLPCETYLDTGNRAAFSNQFVISLHPSFAMTAESAWFRNACAPLVETGPRLAAVRARLAEQAVALGYRCISAKEIVLDEAGCTNATVAFDVDTLHLMSLARRVPGDCRLLGALITAIHVDGIAVPLEDSRLFSGFHEIECHDERIVRWTNGAAILTIGRAAAMRHIDIHVATLATLQARQGFGCGGAFTSVNIRRR